MEVRNPKEFFEEILPKKFDPSKAGGIDCVVQMSIGGENGGAWEITIRDQKISIREGIHPSPTVTVKMKDIDYLNMVNGKLSGERAFLMGKLRFKGRMATGLKLKSLGII